MNSAVNNKQINTTMRILTGIAIIQVVMGHLDFDVLSIGGLFPYYSFHVMVFVFVSGYFYKPEYESGVLKYVGKKALHLLVPYYIWNLIYGIISTILNIYGYTYTQKITPMNFLIEPFLGGHQYGLNFAAWFIPALFLIEVINILIRKILTYLKLNKDIFILVVTLILGVACVYLAQTGHVWGWYKTPGRILFMLPVYEMGRVYHIYVEIYENKISGYVMMPIIVCIQLALIMIADGAINFSAVWCTGFASWPIMPYLTIITGTLFWIRVSRFLAQTGRCRLLEAIGADSFGICMHHVAIFFLINTLTMAICNLVKPAYAFDMNQYISDVNYVYMVGGIYAWKLVYATLAIAGSILISRISKKLVKKVQKV